MKIQVMSDIHLEFGDLHDVGALLGSIDEDKDATLVIAGDIGLLKKPTAIEYFVEEVAVKFKYVVLISGNHEVYSFDIANQAEAWDDIIKDIPNVFWLDNETITLDGINFIGSTFWSDITTDPVHRFRIQSSMNDYAIINSNGKPFTVEDSVKLHIASRNFVFNELNTLFGQKNVVVTHHNPTMHTAKIYRGNFLNSAYGTDYEDEIKSFGPKLWIYGHTHHSADYMVGETRLICNPRGYIYRDVNKEFNTNLEIEV